MKCPECGHANPDDFSQCEKCSELLDDSAETGIRPSSPPGVDDSSVTGIKPGGSPLPDDSSETGLRPQSSMPGIADSSEARTEFGGRQGTPSSGISSSDAFASSGSTGAIPTYASFGDRYEILELLGEGGMGRVYKAWDRELEKVIALKTIRGEKAKSPEILKRFKQELLLARKITHKNVIRIHDMGESNGVRFFTMEYIPGESLKERIQKRGKIPAEQAIPMVRQIVSALEEAHEQGVVHRDLKPQNIMIDQDGMLHIMDFGIARSAQDTAGLTGTGMVMGTPDYMSPEQVKGDKVGPESDLFSFGVILYEMLTGDLPYPGDTTAARAMMRLSKQPQPPREIDEQIPQYMESIVIKCLEIDRELRYQKAREILEDLDREQVDRSLGLRLIKGVARSRAGLAAAVAVAVAVAATLYVTSTRPAPSAESQPGGPVTTLAILPFTNASGSEEVDWLRTGLSEMLVTDISQSQYVRPVSSGRVIQVLRELGVAEQTRFDDAALESVSQRAPADSVLYGQFVESSGSLRLDLTLRKAGSGVPIALKVSGNTSDIFSLVDDITSEVKQHLDLTPEQLKGDTDQPIADVSTASLEALRDYQAGLSQLQGGANQAAIPLLKQATETDPNFAMAYAKLAEAYLNAGQIPEAETAVEEARTLSESTSLPLAERYQIHAMEARVKDDFETAAESYRELAKLYPEDPDIQLSLARSLEELGNFPEASAAYQQVLDMAPGYAETRFGLAWAQVMSGRPDDAITLLEDALAKGESEDDPEAMGMTHSILGVAYRNSSRPSEAIEHFDLSLQFREQAGDERGRSVTLENLVSVYLDLGDMDRALDAQEKALAIAREIGDREGESSTLLNIGITYKFTGQLDKALVSFRESMEIEMERQDHVSLAVSLDNIAEVYRIKGQYGDAIVYLEQAKSHLAQSGDRSEQEMNLIYTGRLRRVQGHFEQALEAFMAALPIAQEIEDQMGVAVIQEDLAEIYARQGRYADAYNSLQQSLDIYAKDQIEAGIAEAKAPLGHLLIALGRPEEAEEQLAEAEQAAQKAQARYVMPEILLGRARAARLQGRYEEAAQALELAKTQADQSGEREIGMWARLEPAYLYLQQGELPNAERLLISSRQEAGQARLRLLEAEAAAALAEVYQAKGDPESALEAATAAIDLAEKFSGRPILFRAHALLGESLLAMGNNEGALDAYAQAVSDLQWMRGSLLPEHVASFTARAEIQAFVQKAIEVLEEGGRPAVVAPLKEWTAPSAAASGS